MVLLAFFNEVPVPADPVRAAPARSYFEPYVQRRVEEQRVLDSVPAEHRDADPPEYDMAEVAAELDMVRHRDAVRQMRANLGRRRDLATAPRTELDERVRGVLIWLNAPALPRHDAVFMTGLRTALGFGTPPPNAPAPPGCCSAVPQRAAGATPRDLRRGTARTPRAGRA